jgi:hypothetical protein
MVSAWSPVDRLFDLIHHGEQFLGRVFQVPILHPAGDTDDRSLGSLGSGKGDGGGTFAEGGDSVIAMVDFTFGKNHQRMLVFLKQADCLFEGNPVGSFTINTENTVTLQQPLSDFSYGVEDMPGGQVMETGAGQGGGFVHAEGVGVRRMIADNHDALSGVDRFANYFCTVYTDVHQLLL